jgi:hypothetical protein
MYISVLYIYIEYPYSKNMFHLNPFLLVNGGGWEMVRFLTKHILGLIIVLVIFFILWKALPYTVAV